MIAHFLLLTTSFSSLDPLSIEQHLAYYKLYPETKEGKKALEHAWKLLGEGASLPLQEAVSIPNIDLEPLIALITRNSKEAPLALSEASQKELATLTSLLPTKKQKGAFVWTEEELVAIPSEEIDLARALLIHQFANDPKKKEKILQYETVLDLMALQIRARLPTWATAEDKIDMISRFIFEEKRYRFPPHSLYAKEIDLYTFLPSVLDNREGVCLGVSILYLCLAQRLNLPLQIITPPGHIYLSYEGDEGIINIETTARGTHMPSEMYLGVNTRLLQKRTMKEVIGLSFINEASVAWGIGDHKKTVALYEKALPYLPEDPLLKMFLGLNYLFTGEIKKGKDSLKEIRSLTLHFSVSKETIPSDFLNGYTDIESIKSVFTHVDETRQSILEKLSALEKVSANYPKFRAALLQVAVCHLQLGHLAEALRILEKYHALDPEDATVEYYLAELYLERFDIQKAWRHFNLAETLTLARDHKPKAFHPLKLSLLRYSPNPLTLH